MIKKGEHFVSNLNGTKKNKLLTEPNQSYSISNKENIFSKSLFENINDSESNLYSNNNKFQQSGFGSTLISPTFQSPDLVNLKDDRFKQGKQQEKAFLNLNFSLKDMQKPSKDAQKTSKAGQISKAQFEQQYFSKISEVEELKKRLIEHYSKKKYWKKIEDLFQKEGVDAVLAWEDAIEKYKTVKNANEQLYQQKQKLSTELQQKHDKISQLQKQIIQDKNETKVISHKKCKGCQHLELKQKEYHQIYEQNKRNLKQIQQLKESYSSSNEQAKRLDDKYKNLVFLKEQLQKKNGKLIQKEKQLLSIIQKMQKTAQEDCSNSKDLYIQIEQLKEAKYQLQRGTVKIDQKYKREIANLTMELNGSEDEKNILLSQSQKLKQELSETKSKLLKQQFELEAKSQATLMKNIQCQDLKKRHIQTLSEQIRKRNDLQEMLKAKDEELKKSYLLIDEMQDIKIKFQQQLNQMKKSYFGKDEQVSKLTETIRNLQQKLREYQQSETRIRQGQNNSIKGKNLTIGNFQGNFQTNSPQSNTLLARVSSKIRQLYLSVMQLNEDNQEGYQRRRPRQDLSQQRQQINLLKTEKQLNQINGQLFTFKNKFDFILKENENLKIQLQNQVCYKQSEAEQLQRQVQLKEEALKTLTCYVPQDLKGIVTDFLYLAEELVKSEDPSDADLEDYDNLRQNVQQQGLEWRDESQKELRRARKLQQQLRKLQEENGQLKRRAKMRDPKKINYTEYDTREVSKKDIRKKYNLDN